MVECGASGAAQDTVPAPSGIYLSALSLHTGSVWLSQSPNLIPGHVRRLVSYEELSWL